MTEKSKYAGHSSGFAVRTARLNKAMKITSILKEYGKGEGYLSLLDIGTGNGEIARYLSRFYHVVSVDVVDQRDVCDGFEFVQLKNDTLPFADKSFDVVISNHVIEHVENADFHLSEIKRVLKEDGLVYLATPNRFWPWEAHNELPLLHYLPASQFNRLLKMLGRYQEDVFLMTWWMLNRKVKNFFSVNTVSEHICKWPLKYHMHCHPLMARILSMPPLWFYQILTFINPTLIVVLKK